MATGMNLGGATFNVNANVIPFQQGLQKAQQQAQAASNAIGQNLTRGTKNAALGFLELSRAVEDAQYGLRGVINNIPTAVQMFGGGAGLAAGISLTAVAVNQLVENWGYLKDVAQSAWAGSSLDQLTQLREKAEEAAEAFEKLMKMPTEMQGKEAKAIEKAIAEGPADEIRKAVAQGVAADPNLQARIGAEDAPEVVRRMIMMAAKRAWQFQEPLGTEEMKKRVMAEMLNERNAETTKGIIGGVAKAGPGGDQARATMRKLMAANPGAFPEGFAGAFEAASPEGQQAKKQFDKEVEVRKEVQKRIAKAEKDQADKLEKEIANHERIVKEKEKREKDAAKAADKVAKEAEREAKHQQSKLEQMLRRDIQGNFKRPEKTEAPELMGLAEFGAMTLKGKPMEDKSVEIQKEQLKVLNDIRQVLADNPAVQAAAGAGMVGGLAALAGGPN